MSERICSIEGCEKRHMCRGWCAMHYQRWRHHGDPLRGEGRTFVSEFWHRVNRRKRDECWEWQGYTLPGGYGQLGIRGKSLLAHRVAWELTNGPISDGLHIDHLCRNRACCNPSHLEPVTPAENNRRGQGPSAINAAKTHCPQGHPYDEENTYIAPGRGTRMCRTCGSIRERANRPQHAARRRQKRREARIARESDSRDSQ